MRIVVATAFTAFVHGGAEILAEDLRDALTARGHEVDLLALPWKWGSVEAWSDQWAAWRLLDPAASAHGPVDRWIALKPPAWYVRHPEKVIWTVHQQRQAYELWDETDGLVGIPAGDQIRDLLHAADRLAYAEASAAFSLTRRVADRLEEHLGVRSEPLLVPPRHAERYRALAATADEAEPYLFFPSRLSPLKRQALVIDALVHTREDVEVRFAGFAVDTPQAEALHARAAERGVSDRVAFLGQVDDDALIEAYARCRGVVFPPFDEDYGYVTAEAMLAAKPVVTCGDSGGPLELVLDGETGWIVESDARAIGAALDALWADPDRARERGLAARRRMEALDLSWDRIVEALTR